MLPLHEVIALAYGTKMESTKAWEVYNSIIKEFDNEFNILMKVSEEKMLSKGFDEKLVHLILKNREEKIKVKPGFDGEYGIAQLGEKQVTL